MMDGQHGYIFKCNLNNREVPVSKQNSKNKEFYVNQQSEKYEARIFCYFTHNMLTDFLLSLQQRHHRKTEMYC